MYLPWYFILPEENKNNFAAMETDSRKYIARDGRLEFPCREIACK